MDEVIEAMGGTVDELVEATWDWDDFPAENDWTLKPHAVLSSDDSIRDCHPVLTITYSQPNDRAMWRFYPSNTRVIEAFDLSSQ